MRKALKLNPRFDLSGVAHAKRLLGRAKLSLADSFCERIAAARATQSDVPRAPLFLLVSLAVACTEPIPVGRKCHVGDVPPDTVVIAPLSVDCESRLCLSIPRTADTLPENSEYGPLCTAMCETDADCVASAESPCQTGFVCRVAMVVGALPCEKLCMCRDYMDEGVIAAPPPAVCSD